MKKLLSVLLSATLLAGFAVLPVSADNGSITTSWEYQYNKGTSDASVTLVTKDTAAISGLDISGNALQLYVKTTNTNANAFAYQSVTGLDIGKTYRFKGKMYCDRASTDSNAKLVCAVDMQGIHTMALLGEIGGRSADDTKGEWKEFDYTFKNDKVTENGNKIVFGLTASGYVILDDLSLVEVVEENGVTRYSEEMIKNGDFEGTTVSTATANTSKQLEGVTGWGNSQWYVSNGYALAASVEILENIAGTPEGSHMLKLSAGGATNAYDNINARAAQTLNNLDTAKTYILTGKVKPSANNTFLKISNTDSYANNNGINLVESKMCTGGMWNDLSVKFQPKSKSVEIAFKAQANRSMYLDDLAVREVETVNGIERFGENLLVNGGFEDDYAIYETGNHTLSGVPGWTKSNWNIKETKSPAGVTLLENLAGAPNGGNVLKVWAGGATGLANHNAHAIQILNGLDKTKTYRLTGSVKHSSNNTAVYLGNTNFNDGKEKQLREHFGGDTSDGKWNTLAIDFKPNDSNNIELRFTASANRSIWLNGLSVKEVLSDGSLGDVEYLKNGSFAAATVTNPVLKAETVFYPAEQSGDEYSILEQTALTALDGLEEYDTNSICASTTVENTTDVAEKVYTYLAVYSGDTLESVLFAGTTVESSDKKETINTYYTIPTGKTNLKLRLFAWDASMKPLGASGDIQ